MMPGPYGSEFYPPPEAFAPRPDPRSLPTDRVGREIAIFLYEHPRLAETIGRVDLAALVAEEKTEILRRIKVELGIPLKPRHPNLGYVGE